VATIREVAREAGVSIATVSHALSGKRPVSGTTRRRVAAAIDRLGYRPNRIAAAMSTGKTETLGMVVPDIANPFFGGLLGTVERAAAGRGYTVVACSSELDAELEARSVAKLRDRRVDALIYLAGTSRPNSALAEVDRAGTPLVALDEELDDLPGSASVLTVDNELGGTLAADHLLGLGHRALGAIAGPLGLPTARARLRGFCRRAAAARAPVPPHRIAEAAAYTHDAGRAAALELLRRELDVTAIFCGNDLIALGALDTARKLGFAVPGRLSVVGFDDIVFSGLISPPLTTIRQPLAELGKEAATLAIDLVEGNQLGPVRRRLPVELVVRSSTAPRSGGSGAETATSRRRK
jgi:DNA-binding LacI/PurR family transcriptional regulator